MTKSEVKMTGSWACSFFLRSYGSRQVEIHKKEKMNEANIQSSWPNKLGQWRIYFMVKKKQYLFEGKDSQPVLLQN